MFMDFEVPGPIDFREFAGKIYAEPGVKVFSLLNIATAAGFTGLTKSEAEALHGEGCGAITRIHYSGDLAFDVCGSLEDVKGILASEVRKMMAAQRGVSPGGIIKP